MCPTREGVWHAIPIPPPGSPFANDQVIPMKAAGLTKVQHTAVRQELLEDISAKHECQGSEGPVHPQVLNAPPGSEILVGLTGVERHQPDAVGPELVVTPRREGPAPALYRPETGHTRQPAVVPGKGRPRT